MLLQLQLYGLVFLLGSLTVAALSDIRRMAAQKDFAEVWVAFTLLFFLYDLYHIDQLSPAVVALKWALIVFFVIGSVKYTQHWFVLSPMDIAAVCAVMSLLNAKHVVLYYFIVFVLKELMNPLLQQFGEAGAYPFLPVVLVSTVVIFVVLSYNGVAAGL
jgi:hypothetical protein